MRVLLDIDSEHVSDDKGAVAIVVAILSLILIVLAAFAVDIGNAYAQVRQLSVAADADALAAAAAVGDQMPPGVACTQSQLDSLTDSAGNVGAVAIARATADALNTANNKSGSSEPVETVTVTCAPSSETDSGTNAIEVRVNTRRSVPTSFAGVIGIRELKPNSYAVARYIRIQSAGGLRPWAVCQDTVDDAQGAQNETFWTGLDRISGPCDTTQSGQWGSVDFDGGSNGAPDLIEWTKKGYPGPVTIPDPLLPADPGVTNAVKDALKSLVGQQVIFPSVTKFNEGKGGNNATFDAVGIATVKVCGIVYGNNTFKTDVFTGLQSDCWVNPDPPTTTTTTTSADDVSAPQSAITSAKMNKNATTLKITTPDFPTTPTEPDVSISVSVSIPGGAADGGPLITQVADFTSANEVELLDKIGTAVPLGTQISFTTTTTTITSTTTTTGGGLPRPTPGPYEVLPNGSLGLLDHIQFRYVNASTTATTYQGLTAEPCDFTDRRCAGATLLWQ